MKSAHSLLAILLLLPACASQTRAPSSTRDPAYAKLLHDSLRFFDEELRLGSTGQYFDARNIGPNSEPDYNSSVAASGMGLISLALGDATGNVPDARAKALRTLEFLLGKGAGSGYHTVRSQAGWFRHWFDARTGENNAASEGDGFSTVDTAILAAGAQLAAKYFSDTGQDKDQAIRRLADEILFTVHWDSAISDREKGTLYLNFGLKTEKPGGSTAVFNEYVLVACLGNFAEKKRGRSDKMATFWNRHYRDPAGLPRKSYEGIDLLTDWPEHFLSSFTLQFATYLCADVSGNAEYLSYLSRQQRADRLWFSKISGSGHFWGLGAGEVRSRKEAGAPIESSYHADAINDDPQPMVSPHIIAGFLPIYPNGLDDLLAMYHNHECLYRFKDLDILWRCNLRDLSLPVDRVQAVDFSSMFLGLSSMDPRVGGLDFFRRYGAGGN